MDFTKNTWTQSGNMPKTGQGWRQCLNQYKREN